MNTTDALKKISLSSLKIDQMNVVEIDSSLTVLVFFDGQTAKVAHDLCPHMGGPLSQGKYCSKTKLLTCPWHGYKYSSQDFTFKENPNDEIWIKPLAGEQQTQYKTPQFKLREIACEIEGGFLRLRDQP